jgi:ribonucleoside-diphosphate reductase alpha chain
MQLTAKQADVYKVSTKEGFELKATAWHKMYVYRDKNIIKIPLNELRTGDRVLVQSGNGVFGNVYDPDLAYVVGLITSDGCIDDTTAIIYLYGDKANIKKEVEEAVLRVFDKYLDENVNYKHNAIFKPTFNEEVGRHALRSQLLKQILEKFNFTKETKTEVPKFVLEGNSVTQGKYLSGLYQMDGTVNCNEKYKAGSIEITQTNLSLLKDVQMMLLNMGIFSTIYDQKNEGYRELPDGHGGKKEYLCKNTYKLTVQDRKSRDNFIKYITLKEVDRNKLEAFTKTLQPTSRTPKHKYTATVSSVEFYGIEDVYDTTQEDFHSLIFNGIVTNNCTEIFQVSKESILNNRQEYDFLGNDISCNLGSTNMTNLMASPDFGKSVRTMLRALTYVTDASNIDVVPSVKNGNDMYHSVGLGVMDAHGFLAKNQIEYGSPEALEIVDTYFMLLNYWTLVESKNIAMERGKTFYEFKRSKYADGTYFDMYLNERDFEFKHERVKEIFKDIFIPTHKDWEELKHDVMKYGVYNAYRLATAPTGSISYVNEATASLHPIVQRIEERTEGKRGKVYYPAPHLSVETIPYYVSAYDIDQRKIIDTYSAAQKHVDQGLSMTLFMREDLPEGMYEWKIDSEHPTKKTTRDLNILRNYAWTKGIKSVYYIRTFTDDGTTVGANECESCSI